MVEGKANTMLNKDRRKNTSIWLCGNSMQFLLFRRSLTFSHLDSSWEMTTIAAFLGEELHWVFKAGRLQRGQYSAPAHHNKHDAQRTDSL